MAGSPREHIDSIRLTKFYIGAQEPNPLAEDLHHAVRHLSVELYSKDVHFLMELIQNADDNQYPAETSPALEFVMTDKDITGVGASATLLVFNNENGFSPANIESLCSVGRSTKKGNRSQGYIGEKGIGFKSVFLVSKQPYVFSNGYRIRFSETPAPGLDIGYIVPEWIDKPTLQDIQEIYGSVSEIPTTTLILPLRDDKIDAVKEQLGSVHPEIILFMSRIKKLCIRDQTKDKPENNTLREISVLRETDLTSTKDHTSQSSCVHLSAEESNESQENGYYLWKQRFPVKPENGVPERADIQEWVVTLAFPIEGRIERKCRGKANPIVNAGIYAFLPTEMVTGLPFIIQADFLLSSSRETILFDNKWNKGILDCIPHAFCSAFLTFLEYERSAPSISKTRFFKYIPTQDPSFSELRPIKDSILQILKSKRIIYCESGNYCTPPESWRILAGFRKFVEKAESVPSEVYGMTRYSIVHGCMESKSHCIRAMNSLGVNYVSESWYSELIRDSGLLKMVSEDLYVRFLQFLEADSSKVCRAMSTIPIIKFVYYSDSVSWASLNDLSRGYSKVYISSSFEARLWMEKWNGTLGKARSWRFLPPATQDAIQRLPRENRRGLEYWLSREANIEDLSVYRFCSILVQETEYSSDPNYVICVAQFLYFSLTNSYLEEHEARSLCSSLPVVNSAGGICQANVSALTLPRSLSKLGTLLRDNMKWAESNFTVLSESYLNVPYCARRLSGVEDIKDGFLHKFIGAIDIPQLDIPDAPLYGMHKLPQHRALLLLKWLEAKGAYGIPRYFKDSIAGAKWLKTYQGFQAPQRCLLFDSNWQKSGFQRTDLNFIDESFYSKPVTSFKDVLESLGVGVEFGLGCCEAIVQQLKEHSEFRIIKGVYRFLKQFGPIINFNEVWIPTGDSTGFWADSESCVCHGDDDVGHFSKYHILDRFYDEDLLDYFSCCVRVAKGPKLEDYCNLWRDSAADEASATVCYSVWKKVVDHWHGQSYKIQQWLRPSNAEIQLPVSAGNGGKIELRQANHVLIPDDLLLKELFVASAGKEVCFAWVPNPSQIAVDSLFAVYAALGARELSSAVKKTGISAANDSSLRKHELGESEVCSKGMYRTILAFLADPAAKIAVGQRHEIIRSLIDFSVFETEEPLAVQLELSLHKTIMVEANSRVRLDRESKRILIHKGNEKLTTEASKLRFANELAEAISSFVLSTRNSDLLPKLKVLLELGAVLGFEDEAVHLMLCSRNLQLFQEDEEFFSSIFSSKNRFKRPCFGSYVQERPQIYELRKHTFRGKEREL